MKEVTVQNKRYRNAFIRLLLMVLLYIMFIIVRTLWLLVSIVQFLAHLFTGRPTEVGVRWGKGLSIWIHEMMLFMTYNTEVMPFPFRGLTPPED
jgi:hypothetical protein